MTTSKVIVIVNKDSISQSDLDNRIKLITLMSGISAQKQDMEKMRNQVLQSLIQEKIQIHAAKGKKVDISESEIEKILQSMAKDNNMTYEQFMGVLSSNNIPKETLKARIRAQIAWVRYIRQQFAPLVHVSDSEVDKALIKIENAKNQTQYLLSEIMLLVNSPLQEKSVRMDAMKLVSDLRAGANFKMMAQQFSRSSNTTGDLGWVTLDQVDPCVATEIQSLKVGDVSSPIRTSTGFKIIKLKEVRKAGDADPNETEISFSQAFFPLTPPSTEEEKQIVLPQVESVLSTTGCQSFEKKIKEYGLTYQRNTNVKLGMLPEQLALMLKSARVGQCTQPLMTERGLLVQMVCDKKGAKLTLPTKDQIHDDLEQQKMSRQATRELQRLMSIAYLDFKDPTYVSVMS